MVGHQQAEQVVLVCDGELGVSEVDDFLEASKCRKKPHGRRAELRLGVGCRDHFLKCWIVFAMKSMTMSLMERGAGSNMSI